MVSNNSLKQVSVFKYFVTLITAGGRSIMKIKCRIKGDRPREVRKIQRVLDADDQCLLHNKNKQL